MTHESSSQLMDQIFTSEDEEAKARLLKILQDFLGSESAKHSAQEKGINPLIILCMSADHRTAAFANKKTSKGVDMEAFVGNTHGFAESG
jgi:cohesin loading factor subunit SCC2